MCTLAHVFEAAGLSTVVLSSIRSVAERIKPPRALYCEFPLGLPLGKPRDPEFQHRVLERAFGLLGVAFGPVLEDFPETIESKGGEPLSCSLPPRFDPNLHPAIDEAQALRNAWNRSFKKTGRTSLTISADQVPGEIKKFVRLAGGESWEEVGLAAVPMEVANDIRTYYVELALELVDGPMEPWAAERWFFQKTEAGKVLLEAKRSMQAAKAPDPIWMYMLPRTLE